MGWTSSDDEFDDDDDEEIIADEEGQGVMAMLRASAAYADEPAAEAEEEDDDEEEEKDEEEEEDDDDGDEDDDEDEKESDEEESEDESDEEESEDDDDDDEPSWMRLVSRDDIQQQEEEHGEDAAEELVEPEQQEEQAGVVEEPADDAPVMTVEPMSYMVGYGDYELDYRPTITREERTGEPVELYATTTAAPAPASPKVAKKPQKMAPAPAPAPAPEPEPAPEPRASTWLSQARGDAVENQDFPEAVPPVSPKQPPSTGLTRIASNDYMLVELAPQAAPTGSRDQENKSHQTALTATSTDSQDQEHKSLRPGPMATSTDSQDQENKYLDKRRHKKATVSQDDKHLMMISRGRRFARVSENWDQDAAAAAAATAALAAEGYRQVGIFGVAHNGQAEPVSGFLRAKQWTNSGRPHAEGAPLSRLPPELSQVSCPPDDLRAERSALPAEVNPRLRELHLSAEDFNLQFGMSLASFAALPRRQQMMLKAELGMLDGSNTDTEITERLAKARQRPAAITNRTLQPTSRVPPVTRLAGVNLSTPQHARAVSPVLYRPAPVAAKPPTPTILTPVVRAAAVVPSPREISPPPLALPGGWSCAVSRSCGKVFYYNRETGVRQWAVPSFNGSSNTATRSRDSPYTQRSMRQPDQQRPLPSPARQTPPRPSPQKAAVTETRQTASASPRPAPATPTAAYSPRTGNATHRQPAASPSTLPPGWRVTTSKSKGLPFYFNTGTGQKQWQHPS